MSIDFPKLKIFRWKFVKRLFMHWNEEKHYFYIGVLSDDFAAVDFREDYANLSLPKEAKFKR